MKKAILPSLLLVFAVGMSFLLPLEDIGRFFFTSAIIPEQTSTEVVQPERKTIYQTGELEAGEESFFLASNRIGSKSFTVDANTCLNGVRILVRGDKEALGNNTEMSLHVLGFSRQKSKQTYSNVLKLTKSESIQVVHLPSMVMHLNETLFPEYQINPSRNTDLIRYDVTCY